MQLTVVAASFVTDASEANVVSTLFPTISQALGLTLPDLGELTAANKVAGAAASPAWMWLARRWSRKGVVVVAAGLWGAWSIAAGFSTSFVQLLLLTSVLAAGFAGALPVITEILADLFDDRARGRAVGLLYAAIGFFAAVAGSLISQLSRIQDGWRIGFWTLGGINIAAGCAVLWLFQDPGLGARESSSPAKLAPHPAKPSWTAVASMFKVPSFNIMLLSRVLSGHLVIAGFGVVFLTSVRHFPNSLAALVWAPFGAGYVIGCIGGALLVDWLHALLPRTGRVLFLQAAQFGFAAVAYFATQFAWVEIGTYMLLWAVLGLLQGVNPGVNRPIVMAVILPELRGWAFVVMITIVESASWAAYSFGTGWLGEMYGLQDVLAVVLVGFMTLNGIVVTLLYLTYGPDAVRVQRVLQARAARPARA